MTTTSGRRALPAAKPNLPLLLCSWVIVLVPLGYGLWQTAMKAMLLFGSE